MNVHTQSVGGSLTEYAAYTPLYRIQATGVDYRARRSSRTAATSAAYGRNQADFPRNLVSSAASVDARCATRTTATAVHAAAMMTDFLFMVCSPFFVVTNPIRVLIRRTENFLLQKDIHRRSDQNPNGVKRFIRSLCE